MLLWTGRHHGNHRSQRLQPGCFLQMFLLPLSFWLLLFPHLLCCLQIHLGFISIMRKGRDGSIGAFFSGLDLFVILMLILNDAFPVVKYMCAHITVPMEDCRWRNGCSILSTLRPLSWTGLQQELGHKKSREKKHELLTLELAPLILVRPSKILTLGVGFFPYHFWEPWAERKWQTITKT